MGSLRLAAFAILIVAAAPAPAAAEEAAVGEPESLAATFATVAETALRVHVEPPAPETWFPVRGTIDFGEADARYGAWRGSRMHEGQDVFADEGTPLVAIRAGRVVETGNDGGRGNYIAIWSPEAERTFVYLHMRAPTPHAVGDELEAGQRVGAVGCTGSCWGYHLHLEMRVGRGTTGKPQDPMPMLSRLARRAR